MLLKHLGEVSYILVIVHICTYTICFGVIGSPRKKKVKLSPSLSHPQPPPAPGKRNQVFNSRNIPPDPIEGHFGLLGSLISQPFYIK